MENSDMVAIENENNYDSKKKGYIYFLRKEISQEESKIYQDSFTPLSRSGSDHRDCGSLHLTTLDSFKIYKIRFTYRQVKERMKEYQGDISLVYKYKITTPRLAELMTIKVFTDKYKLVHGRDWFIGHKSDMINDIIDISK
jgi:hypothetical protein